MAENGTEPGRGGEPAADPQSGVLGNLPRSRPSVRSPRRRAAAPEPGGPNRVDGVTGPETTEAEPKTSSQAELEALARGGLTIAGEAASLGLRIAGRAAAAVRGAVERR